MNFRVSQNGVPFQFPDGSDRITTEDIYCMDVDQSTAEQILRVMDYIGAYMSESAEWQYQGAAYKVERMEE